MDGLNLSAPRPRRTTAIFAKKPVPGMVKTRLCPPLRAAGAARLAEAMLGDVVERFAPALAFHTALYYAPEGSRSWFSSSFPALGDLRPQVGSDLARRLEHFFREELLGTVDSTAVAIGSDAPLVTVDAIVRAHDRLGAGADVVLGPDSGGGYYLIGMREAHTELFRDVPMSTEVVLERTLENARRIGLSVAVLDPCYDVDVELDLERLRADLALLDPGDPRFPRRTAACLETLSEARA